MASMDTKPIKAPENWRQLEYHEYSELTAFEDGLDIDAMAAYMKSHGYDRTESVVLLDGKILKGRHRHAGACLSGARPSFREYIGDNPRAYVAKKVFRQHLTKSQQAMQIADYESLPNQNGKLLATSKKKPSRRKLAKKVKISRTTLAQGEKVSAQGTEALKAAVRDGRIVLEDAATVAEKSPEEQDTIVAAVLGGATLAEAIKNGTAATSGAATYEPAADPDGLEIPEEAAEAFTTAECIAKLCCEIDDLGRRVALLGKQSGGEMVNVSSITQTLQNVRQTLYQSRATHVCPYCDGKDMECEACKGRFWTTRSRWSASPKVEARRR